MVRMVRIVTKSTRMKEYTTSHWPKNVSGVIIINSAPIAVVNAFSLVCCMFRWKTADILAFIKPHKMLKFPLLETMAADGRKKKQIFAYLGP